MREHLKGDESLSVCLHLVPRPTTCLCTVVQKRYKYSFSITLFNYFLGRIQCLWRFSETIRHLGISVVSIISEQPYIILI